MADVTRVRFVLLLLAVFVVPPHVGGEGEDGGHHDPAHLALQAHGWLGFRLFGGL